MSGVRCFIAGVLCEYIWRRLFNCIFVSDESERRSPGSACGWFASHKGLLEKNTDFEGETYSTAGPVQHKANRKVDHTAEQSR